MSLGLRSVGSRGRRRRVGVRADRLPPGCGARGRSEAARKRRCASGAPCPDGGCIRRQVGGDRAADPDRRRGRRRLRDRFWACRPERHGLQARGARLHSRHDDREGHVVGVKTVDGRSRATRWSSRPVFGQAASLPRSVSNSGSSRVGLRSSTSASRQPPAAGAGRPHRAAIDATRRPSFRPELAVGTPTGITRTVLATDPVEPDETLDPSCAARWRSALAARFPALAGASWRGGWAGTLCGAWMVCRSSTACRATRGSPGLAATAAGDPRRRSRSTSF